MPSSRQTGICKLRVFCCFLPNTRKDRNPLQISICLTVYTEIYFLILFPNQAYYNLLRLPAPAIQQKSLRPALRLQGVRTMNPVLPHASA